MGKEYTRSGVVDTARMIRESQQLIDSLGFAIDAHARVDTLSTAQQQVVEIAKALSYDSRILIMDEPTASLTSQRYPSCSACASDARRRHGHCLHLHRMDEVEQIADRVTVMKDGRTVGVLDKEEFSPEEAVKMMVGRTLMQIYSTEHQASEETVFEVRNFKVGRKTKPFDLHLKKGEILGIGGLVGAGRTEFAQAVFGARECGGGDVYLRGEKLTHRTPRSCIRKGMVYLSEDRKVEGLVLAMKISENISLASLHRVRGKFFLSSRKERSQAHAMIDRFSIICRGITQSVGTLSGGNQQKVCFAKCYAAEPDVFILDEPTRGVDVNAKSRSTK